MLELQLEKLAWEEAQEQAQAQREAAQARAQVQRDNARAELKTQMALKEAALRAEFRKKELEERGSRSGTASLTSSTRSRNSKAVGMKTGCKRIDVPTEISHSAPAVGQKKSA